MTRSLLSFSMSCKFLYPLSPPPCGAYLQIKIFFAVLLPVHLTNLFPTDKKYPYFTTFLIAYILTFSYNGERVCLTNTKRKKVEHGNGTKRKTSEKETFPDYIHMHHYDCSWSGSRHFHF